ncbi:MAG: penicillin-binding protein 2, partial [Pseudomonadota bacterium]
MGGRLYALQVRRREEYALLAEDNRVSQRLLMPPRGNIIDRRGRILAENRPSYRVRIIREDAGDVEQVLNRLKELIALPPDKINTLLEQTINYRSFVPITIIDGLNWQEISAVAIHSPDLPGIVLDAGLMRHYPYRNVLAHILGYVGSVSDADLERDNDPILRLPEFRIGKSGLESNYDQILRGKTGSSRVEVNALGREIRELDRQKGAPGNDVTLTLDVELQQFCFERLSSELSASAAVIDVNSGAVHALASVPSFNPTSFANGLSQRDWRELSSNPRTPLVNKTISGQYPPGSTFKMITALAALESGILTQHYEAFCPGHMSLGNARFHCWKQHGHGRISLVQALAQSCDVYFYDVARRVGVDAIAAMARKFGLGEVSGIDLPNEASGLVPTSEWKKSALGESWQRGETLVIGIGQGYLLTTPLQL